MTDRADVIVLRFGWVYHAIGLLFVFLAAAFPVLMWLNNEELDGTLVGALVVLALIGWWTFLYSRAYEVSIADGGFTLRRFGFRAREVEWSSVVAVRFRGADVRFEVANGRAVSIYGYLPGLSRLLTAAEERLPPTMWRD